MSAAQTVISRPTAGLSPLLRSPLLNSVEERRLFDDLQTLKRDAQRANYEALRNRIVVANLRLVVSAARQFITPELPLDDLVSAGILPLIRAVELFDPARGFRFSTYATYAVRNHLIRVRGRHARTRQRENCLQSKTADDCPSRENSSIYAQMETDEDLSRLRTAIRQLSRRDHFMLSARFGFGDFETPRTFRELAELTGLSRERVRILTHRAVERLRDRFHLTVTT